MVLSGIWQVYDVIGTSVYNAVLVVMGYMADL